MKKRSYIHSNQDTVLHTQPTKSGSSVEKSKCTWNCEAYCNDAAEIHGTQNTDDDNQTTIEPDQDIDVSTQKRCVAKIQYGDSWKKNNAKLKQRN